MREIQIYAQSRHLDESFKGSRIIKSLIAVTTMSGESGSSITTEGSASLVDAVNRLRKQYPDAKVVNRIPKQEYWGESIVVTLDENGEEQFYTSGNANSSEAKALIRNLDFSKVRSIYVRNAYHSKGEDYEYNVLAPDEILEKLRVLLN